MFSLYNVIYKLSVCQKIPSILNSISSFPKNPLINIFVAVIRILNTRFIKTTG